MRGTKWLRGADVTKSGVGVVGDIGVHRALYQTLGNGCDNDVAAGSGYR